MKRRIVLSQVQTAYGENVYLPYSVGLLWAYAKMFPDITDEWEEPVFLYKKQPIQDAVSQCEGAELVALSCYIWNWEWNRALAQELKRRNPQVTVIYGGVHVPDKPAPTFFDDHPEVDFLLHGEGEYSFVEFLKQYMDGKEWEQVPGLSFRSVSTARASGPLDVLRSPYLDGVFDSIINKERRWQVLQETNRGCPYACTFFCEWGAAALNKIRQFPIDRVKEELDWFGRNRTEYLDNADANFGILQRDEEIAELVVKAYEKYGYPKKFRTSFAKYSNVNISERVYRISKMLHKTGQLKAVTLALQSTDDNTMEIIKRKNISLDGFADWQSRYQDDGIPTYTELILGLPGETFETFCAGIDKVLDSGQHKGLFIYMLTMLPNSEMSHPVYAEQHGLKSVRMQAMLSHGTPTAGVPVEYQDTVIETKYLSHAQWERAYMLSWIVQSLHSFGLTTWWALQQRKKGIKFTEFYGNLLDFAEQNEHTVLGRVYRKTLDLMRGAVQGGSWNNVLPEFGDISWPADEGGFLEIMKERERFYDELESLGMPAEQRKFGPAPLPEDRDEWENYAREIVWYGRKGSAKKREKVS